MQILCSSTLYNNAKVVDQISNLVAIANSNIFPLNSFYISPVVQWAAITEMVPNSFGPRNLGPKKFGLHVKTIVRHFQGPNFAGPKFLPIQFQKIKVDNKRINLPRYFYLFIEITRHWWIVNCLNWSKPQNMFHKKCQPQEFFRRTLFSS